MKKRVRLFLGLCMVISTVSACRGERVLNAGTEQTEWIERLEVGDGMIFETLIEEVSQTTETDLTGLVLTAEDVEGKQEKKTDLIKFTKIYAKPVKTSSVIGECAKGESIGVYGKLEDGEWYIVNYNGRIGYAEAKCIKESSGSKQENGENSNTSKKPTNNQSNNSNAGQTQKPENNESQTPQKPDNNESQTPQVPENSEMQVPENSETVTPDNGGMTPETPENSESQTPQIPENSETQVPEDSESPTPDINDTTQTPENNENQNMNEDTSEMSETSESQTAEQNMDEVSENTERIERKDKEVQP